MKRQTPPAASKRPAVLIEALEPRIAPAGLLNESKFTSVAVGGTLLLDASGQPGTFQGLTTGSGGGSGSYLLYLNSGRALVFTTDINGNGRLDPGEVTGIALGKDSLGHDPALTLFSDINGDIVTNLDGTSGSTLTDSDRNPNNGRDGQLLTDTNITSITLRTLTSADIDATLPGNTVTNRLALTSFSIHGNVVAGGNIGAISIDTSGTSLLAGKFSGAQGDQLFTGAIPSIGGLYTGTAANNLSFHFTQSNPTVPQLEGTIQGFHAPVGEHGGDISNVSATRTDTTFSIGTLATGDGGTGVRGGDLNNIVMHGAEGGYQLIAGNGGDGGVGGQGGSIHGFNDLGSVTSEVILHTGNGGTGLLGAGGAGGTADFATTNIAAGVQVFMGSGGGGFGNGGNGASFNSANFNTPETAIPVGSQVYGSWHDIGDVGHTHPLPDGTYAPQVLNFNGLFDPQVSNPAGAQDNYGDAVFTTSVPNAVNVVFGDGSGALNGTIVNLKVPGVTNPVVTIGDFNGDGRPDIAVASGDTHNFGGIYVFLNQIGTALDPINSHNFTRSSVGDHPFSAPLQTALPTLTNQPITLTSGGVTVYQTSGAVTALAAGDYNGDGITDIAYVQNVTAEVTFDQFQVVGILLGDASHNATTGAVLHDATTNRIVGSGYFYANAAPAKGSAVLLNALQRPGIINIQATSLDSGNLPDAATGLPVASEVLIYTKQGDKSFTSYSLSAGDPINHLPAFGGFVPTTTGLGRVDTNRVTGTPNDISLVDATLQDLTIQDINNDGTADIVVLVKTPANFLVSFSGNGDSSFTLKSNPFAGTGSTSNENSGIFLGGNQTVVAITASDSNTDPAHVGTFNTVAYLSLPTIPGPFINEVLFRDATGAPAFDFNNGDLATGNLFVLGTNIQDTTVRALDTFYATVPTLSATTAATANLPAVGYSVLSPESSDYRQVGLVLFSTISTSPVLGLPTEFRYLTSNGYQILGGDGGSSVTGIGGSAGSIGSPTAAVGSGQGAVAIFFPASETYVGTSFLIGGSGGNGYGGGGVGGDIAGVTVRYNTTRVLTSEVTLTAGNGGNGIGGDGGRGGNLSLLSIATGIEFDAGNGGSGLHGGQGGSITGNQSGVYDTSTAIVTLTTGIGGQGAQAGGAGGDISKWSSQLSNVTGSDTFLVYQTGSGGSAAGGPGGNGGGILNSSPDQNVNNLAGVLSLTTGAGGNGLTGGNGGAIDTFVNSATTQSAVPTALTVTTGNGGIGVSGAGGTGGAITRFSSNATGLTNFSSDNLTGLARVITGDGGTSYGAAGGIGGTINSTTATATSTPMVVAGGAGGTGLTVGGNGGSVTNSQLNSAALQIGKMLVVGGVGGDALAAQPQDITLTGDIRGTDYSNDLAHTVLAFGGIRGTGGNGGNITNITQPVGAQTAVDLIAGNGGSTINAGTVTSGGSGVGIGGSVTGVTLTGTVGAISRDVSLGAITNPPIKSYSFTNADGTINHSISAFIDFLAQPGNTDFPLIDAVGNVGIVAGQAGLVRGGQPAQNGVNGDVINITATSIMSIVAGSVDRVAPVRVVSGLTVTNSDGVLGADKSPNSPYGPNGALDYFVTSTSATPVTSLSAGYSLTGTAADGTPLSGDGAIFASVIQSTAGAPIRGPRVFPAAT